MEGDRERRERERVRGIEQNVRIQSADVTRLR